MRTKTLLTKTRDINYRVPWGIIKRGYRDTEGKVHKGYIFTHFNKDTILIDCPTCKYIDKGKTIGKDPASSRTWWYFVNHLGRQMLCKMQSNDRNDIVSNKSIENITNRIASNQLSFQKFLDKGKLYTEGVNILS